MLTLMLVCAFSPRVHSIPRGPLISAQNDIKVLRTGGIYFIKIPENGENKMSLSPTSTQYLVGAP